MKKFTILMIILALTLLAGCGGKPENPSIRGEITSMSRDYLDARIRGTILVEGESSTDTGYDWASIRLTRDTIVLNENNKRIEIEDIKEGQQVAVWFTGAVAESYPVQATAARVKIISNK